MKTIMSNSTVVFLYNTDAQNSSLHRQSIKGTAQASTFLDLTGKTLTHLIVALPEPFRSRALNKGNRTWTNLRMQGEGKGEMFVKPSKFKSESSKHQ